jgi:hypothetical protein
MEVSASIKRKRTSLENELMNQIEEELKEKRENIASWLTYSLRELMTYENVRNSILRKYLVDIEPYHLGSTFSYLEKKDQPMVEKYLDSLPLKKISLFTASNFVPEKKDKTEEQNEQQEESKWEQENPETHYQSFIYDPFEKKLYVIDPALSFGSEYQREITNEVIIPFFLSKKGLTDNDIILVPNYCQLSVRDVFCQTWTLILLIQTINKRKNITFIQDKPKTIRKKVVTPRKQKRPIGFLRDKTTEEKRLILKDFFVKILEDKNMCKKFKEIYYKSIQEIKKSYPYLFIKNPCKDVKNLLEAKDF